MFPVAVTPQDVRLISVDQILDLGKHVLVDVPGNIAGFIPGMKPFIKGIVNPKFQITAGSSIPQGPEKIPLRTNLLTVPGKAPVVSLFIRPQGVAVVMLRGDDQVFGAGSFKQFNPFFRMIIFSFELGCQIVIRPGSILLPVVFVDFITLELAIPKECFGFEPMKSTS